MEKLPLIKVEINLHSDGSWTIKGGKLEEVPKHFLDAVVAHLTESMNQRIELVPKKQPGKMAHMDEMMDKVDGEKQRRNYHD